ncbi:MAG: hypothetical protein K5893_06785 [Prevotella sp.]|nr:hypothetical protein [Prevotella sp.]
MKHCCLYIIVMLLLTACTQKPDGPISHDSQKPDIYPNYTDIIIPQNIAPLNFLVREEGCEAVQVEVKGAAGEAIMVNANGNEVVFDMDEWKEMLQESPKQTLTVTLTALINGKWTQYEPFGWTVAPEKIDPVLTYRLIEPDYEVWSNVELWQRNIENFDESTLSSYKEVGDRCMNCHTFANQNPQLSMLYVRGEGGGAFLNQNGSLSKLNIKTDDMVSGSVYFGFSPSGRYITFSTNLIIPAFHAMPRKRLEVFDSKSDVYVADLQTHTIVSSPLTADSLRFETFPTFSPDGRYIYYCASPHVKLPGEIKQLQYRLCRIAFDEKTGTLGETVDTLTHYSATEPSSVSHPRISPDGRWLLYSVADYGTFPIWHPEADLRMMDLKTGQQVDLPGVNSQKSDTYHSWSSNSRWFVFASKRDDGLYGKPYFCYIDANGRVSKPFCLPQKDPSRYDNMLKSFNAPELGKGALPFDAADVARAMKQQAIPFATTASPRK